MKNLNLLSCDVREGIPNIDDAYMSIDVDTATVYLASSTHFLGFLPDTDTVIVELPLVGNDSLPDIDTSQGVIGVQHLPILDGVCFATALGDVVLFETSTQQLECVGSVEGGLTCMSWSPDQEIVAFTTGKGTIILMNKDFDPVSEQPIHSEIFAPVAPVNVGWGKKETQFHGSLGKQAATSKNKEDSDTTGGLIGEDDDKKPCISWRGDGLFFVVSSVTEKGTRELRVWSREGNVISTSELVRGIGMALDWRPSGNLIASVQTLADQQQVIFFEKNGLRHGEFSLRSKDTKVVKLTWNIDSSVLAVWNKTLSPETKQFYDSVQFWYSSNYHWFLKQELRFTNDPVNDMCWDCENVLKFHVLTKAGSYISYQFCWEIFQTHGHHVDNDGTVVMVDGDNLLLTPMSSLIIPPPMSAHSCQTQCAINQVSFHPTCQRIALLLADGGLVIVKKTKKNGIKDGSTSDQNSVEFYQARVNLEVDKRLWIGPGHLRQLSWWKHDTLLACGKFLEDQTNVVCEILLSESDGEYKAVFRNISPVENLLRLAVNPDTGSVAVECANGSILKYSSESGVVQVKPWLNSNEIEVVLPQPCIYIETVQLGREEVVVGLTEHSRLCVNAKEIANNCSSFFIHDEYLLWTTSSHVLRSLSILPDANGLASLMAGKVMDENVRNVERGSKIITAITQDTKLILQMPRGNLEAIHPRVLLLSYLKKCLDNVQYKDAFTCMRRHRINLNLIYDHDSQLFLDNVETFIRQVESVTFLNMFLSELKAEDLTQTLYSECYREKISEKKFESKVNTICDAVRKAVETVDPNKYLLCVLTSHVKKSPPELETALEIVKNLKDSKRVEDAEDALKYLLFLVDVNKMYDVALGMYDFHLVLMVAEKSQKDPKEYLPFLNNLRKMEENYQRYSIDKYLKRYSKAIGHLANCGTERFNECLELIKEQNLYTEALRLYSGCEYKTIAACYGEYLIEKKRYEEAGLVLFRCENYERALEAFQKCGNWRQVFCVATGKLKFSTEQILHLARTMSGYLKEHDRFAEAAVVLVDYANDYEEAIECVIHGKLWEEALRLIYKHERTDIIETHLQPALCEVCEQTLASLESKKIQFNQYKTRLTLVREEKEKRKLEMIDNDLEEDLNADLFSDISSITGQSTMTSSSVSSRASRSTGKSSKNRKKSQRKKVSLKEGSQFEDFALMEALAEIISFVDKMQQEVSELLRMLVLFGHEEDANKLQATYGEILEMVRGSLTDVWPPVAQEDTTSMSFGPHLTSNTIVHSMKNNEKTQRKDSPAPPVAPVLQKFLQWQLDQLK